MNAETLIDGYKLDHRRQYPAGTEMVYSNWTPRKSRVEGSNHAMFLGMQYFIMEYLDKQWDEFFNSNLNETVDRYTALVNSYLGPNEVGAEHIKALHALGYMPLRIRALPEGTLVPMGVPMFTIENTHPDFFWLVNYLETIISNVLWMPCTSGTTAARYLALAKAYSDKTCDTNDHIPYQFHDFSFRGMPGVEAACLSGMGHLASFDGTDTLPAKAFVQFHYGATPSVGVSVAATEHSVACAHGSEAYVAVEEEWDETKQAWVVVSHLADDQYSQVSSS